MHQLDLHYSIILLVTAVCIVSVCRRFNVSSVLGYIMAGALIGPHVLGFVANTSSTELFGKVGILLLLFMVGLDLPYDRLKSLRSYVFGLGFLQVFVTAAFTSTLVMVMHGSLREMLVIGLSTALSSTAFVLQILSEHGELASQFGRMSFSILLFQDLTVVLVLVILTALIQSEGSIFYAMFFTIIKACCVVGIIALLGKYVIKPVYRWIAALDNAELMMATTLLVALGTSLFTQIGGLSNELGAFLAGLVLASTEYKHQVEADIEPFRGLLVGLFFITVGMSLNFPLLFSHFALVFFTVLSIFVIKIVVLGCVAWLFGVSKKNSVRLGFLLAPGSELIFVILLPAVSYHLISDEMANILYLSTVISIVFGPMLNFFGQKIATLLDGNMYEQSELKSNAVVIAGFSNIVEILASILQKNMIEFIIVDNNPARVLYGRKLGLPVFLGDAKRIEVLKAVGTDDAQVVVIATNQYRECLGMANILRRYYKTKKVCAYTYDFERMEVMKQKDVNMTFLDPAEHAIEVARSVLSCLSYSEDELEIALGARWGGNDIG